MDDEQELSSTSEENSDASVSNNEFYYDTEESPQSSNSITPEPVAKMPEPVAEMPEPVAEMPEPVAEMPEPIVDEIEEIQGNQPDRFVLIIDEVLVKLEDMLAVFCRTKYTDLPDPTPPNANRNMRPDDGQSSHTPQILEISAQNNNNPQEQFVLPVNRNAMMALSDNRNERVQQVRRMQDGRIGECMIQGGEYRNHNNFGNMLYDLNNQQPRYYSPLPLEIYGWNPNTTILHRPELFISPAIRPYQLGWIYLPNPNSQALTQLIPRNENNFVQRNMVQGTYENRGINSNIQLNVNHQWQGNRPPIYGHNQNLQGNQPPMYGHNQNLQGNRPPMYGHNQNLQGNQPPMYGHNQNFHIPHQGTNYSQGTWNTHVRGNIPTSQNFQHGWNSQRPHNDRMPQSGNSNNFPRFGRIPGGVHENHMNFENMHYNLNIQHGYRPRAYGQNQNMNFPQAQEMHSSNGVRPTYYVRNFTTHQNDESGYGPSVSHNGMGAFGNGNDNGFQRGGRNPRREN